MYKIALSSCGFELNEQNFSLLSESGISAVEISMAPELYEHIDYRKVKALSEKYGVDLWSYHLPFSPFDEVDISSADPDVRKRTVQYLCGLIKKGADIGIDKFIVHPSAEPIEDSQRHERVELSKKSLSALAQTAAENGAVVAVENLPRTCLGNNSNEIEELLTADSRLRVCFDTNHLLQENYVDFMHKIADKIITLHVSDYDFLNERHWLCGEGKLNWAEVYRTLREIGYNGTWLYEVSLEAPKTIRRGRNLTFADFYENAKCIFDGGSPQPIGVPFGNLSGWRDSIRC